MSPLPTKATEQRSRNLEPSSTPRSLEFLSLYQCELSNESIDLRLGREAKWVKDGGFIHRVVMIDDYFLCNREDTHSIDGSVNLITKGVKRHGLEVAHIVRESALTIVAKEFFRGWRDAKGSVWTEAQLAASLQLVRLGLADAPEGFVLSGHGPFPAMDTVVSVLSHKFMPMEAKVRELLKTLPDSESILERIQYIFC